MGCDWNCSGLVTVISQHSPMEPTPRLDMSVHMQSKPPLMLAVLRPLMSLAQQSSYYNLMKPLLCQKATVADFDHKTGMTNTQHVSGHSCSHLPWHAHPLKLLSVLDTFPFQLSRLFAVGISSRQPKQK
ncbi:uncharacterized protein LOC141581653 isoform X2 [Saimiri boliviensis]|uniref:uncharacterized protein LOC141581653 isoform X2 n=1 Tax=Saimiri boliviensis TaxID=27679 RepID=UPI003D7857FC